MASPAQDLWADCTHASVLLLRWRCRCGRPMRACGLPWRPRPPLRVGLAASGRSSFTGSGSATTLVSRSRASCAGLIARRLCLLQLIQAYALLLCGAVAGAAWQVAKVAFYFRVDHQHKSWRMVLLRVALLSDALLPAAACVRSITATRTLAARSVFCHKMCSEQADTEPQAPEEAGHCQVSLAAGRRGAHHPAATWGVWESQGPRDWGACRCNKWQMGACCVLRPFHFPPPPPKPPRAPERTCARQNPRRVGPRWPGQNLHHE